ncbi:MAG: hypothetical protein KME05_22015 [Gloeocapsa sp. UFS-A4-WI-NPMV-4B04]|jgi:nucleoside-diphosphate-sugar epimerase|nr:hypothetical protein [Gloeocapsa sp. UFS-A4-WI-NPMV-4B04]
MAEKLTILVVDSTGMLGFKIVSALLDKGNLDVRAMVRLAQSTTLKEPINDSKVENRSCSREVWDR